MAKNIKDFIPGFSGKNEQITKKEFIWVSMKAPGQSRSGAYGNICGRFCYQSNYDYAGGIDVNFFGASSSTGGANCCTLAGPAGSGTYAKFSVSPYTPADAQDTLCWHTHMGGCCTPGQTSSGGCYSWFKDPSKSAGCILFWPGWCSCGECNAPQKNCCWTVCYQSGQCREQSIQFANTSAYDCRNCFTQAGTIPAAEFWLDSEVTMFPKVHGFVSTSECGNTGGSNVCSITQFSNWPAVADGKKEHYHSQSYMGENCAGGPLSVYATRYWYGACNGTNGISSICTAGMGSYGASSQSSNCYCGGPDQGGIFVSLYYKLNSTPVG